MPSNLVCNICKRTFIYPETAAKTGLEKLGDAEK